MMFTCQAYFFIYMDEIKMSFENTLDMNRDDEDMKNSKIGKLKNIIKELEG